MKSIAGQLKDKPLIVITASKAGSADRAKISQKKIDDIHNIFQALQKDLVTKSTRGKQVFAENSDHMIPYHQPEIIVDAVREIVQN